MQEIWKPIKDFEELYYISNLGNIKSIGRYKYNFITKQKVYEKKCTYLKANNDRGYKKIVLSKNGKRTLKYIHRLVAEAFIPNLHNYKEINHKDSDPSNNRVDNLEWCDRKYNLKYMIEHQERIRNLNEMRHEALEDIYYGIDSGRIKTFDEIKVMIEPLLKNE